MIYHARMFTPASLGFNFDWHLERQRVKTETLAHINFQEEEERQRVAVQTKGHKSRKFHKQHKKEVPAFLKNLTSKVK